MEHLKQLHLVSQKGQVLHQHDINAPGRQGSSLRAGVSAWHCPMPHNPTVRRDAPRAAGGLGAQWLHEKHWCNCPAEVKCCCLHSRARGLDWYLCWRMPSAVSQHSFSWVHYDLPNSNKKAGFYFDFSLYFKCCDKMTSQQQGMQCTIIMNIAGPQNWVGTQATLQMLAYNLPFRETALTNCNSLDVPGSRSPL